MTSKFDYFPKEILKSTELTSSEKIICLYLFHISGWDEDKTINRTQIAEKLGINRRTIINAFKKFDFLGLVKENPDKTFDIYLAGSKFENRDFMKNKLANKMIGDFIKVPLQFLFDKNLTAAERLCLMMLFDFYFDIDSKGNFKNKSNVVFKTIATLYNISESTINEHLQNIKSKGAIDYKIYTSRGRSKVYGFKFFKQETISVYLNGKTTKKGKIEAKTEEEVIEPTELVEEEITKEIEEVFTPTEKDRKEFDRLLLNLKDCFKLEYERDIKYYRLDDQIVWLRKRQN